MIKVRGNIWDHDCLEKERPKVERKAWAMDEVV